MGSGSNGIIQMAKTNTGICNVSTLNFACEDWHEFLIRNQLQVDQYAPGCNTASSMVP